MVTIIWNHTKGDWRIWETKGLAGQPDAIDKAIYLAGYSPPNFPVPAIQYDVLFRPMGVAITRDYDGPNGDRFTFERTWFRSVLGLN